MPELMIELGVEELPSSYMVELNEGLEGAFVAFLKEHRWQFETANLMLTPRRMIFHVQALAPQQEALVQKIKGPPKKAAFGGDGNPSPALKGFLSKCKTDQWYEEDTLQGAYIFAEVTMECLEIRDFFMDYFPPFVQNYPYKKTMRWSNHVFIRPLRWICAFEDQQVIPISLFGLEAAPYTHALHGDDPIKVESVCDYFESLHQHEIIYRMQDRIEKIEKSLPFSTDSSLIRENANRTESPVLVHAHFPERFLTLPSEIIHTVISDQMKCFPEQETISSRTVDGFYVVMNGRKNTSLVSKGFEKVVSARLNDAEYFYQQDLKIPLGQRGDDLKSMVFMEKSGSVYGKVQRIKNAALDLDLYASYPALEPLLTVLKNDLSTRVVAEFPVLQGTMGKIYAQQEVFPEGLALAIEEHYFPKFEGDVMPQTPLGLISGLLDRTDTITGAGIYEIPFSSSLDPFGLRRCLNGLIRLFLENELKFSPLELFKAAWKSYEIEGKAANLNHDQQIKLIGSWFSQRGYLMLSQKYSYDLIQAAQTEAFENPRIIVQKILLLEQELKKTSFRELCEAYTRIKNILKETQPDQAIDTSLFEHVQENDLYHSVQSLKVQDSQLNTIHSELMEMLYTIHLPVQNFFEHVFVMSEDSKIRNNRLRLIYEVYAIIHKYFDLSKIVFEGGSAS